MQINIEILKSIIEEHNISNSQLSELSKLIDLHTPLHLVYKNGFANCNCGCEFESEGYQGEEFCPECGQHVYVGEYKGQIIKNNLINFPDDFSDAITIPKENIYTDKFIKASKEANDRIESNHRSQSIACSNAANEYFR